MRRLLAMQINRAKSQLERLRRAINRTSFRDEQSVVVAQVGAELARVNLMLSKLTAPKLLDALGPVKDDPSAR
jgi:hypothetical protein